MEKFADEDLLPADVDLDRNDLEGYVIINKFLSLEKKHVCVRLDKFTFLYNG